MFHVAVLQRSVMMYLTVLNTDYADDVTVLDNSMEGLQGTTDTSYLHRISVIFCASMMPKLVSESNINAKKTEAMTIAKNTTLRPYTEEATAFE